MAGGDNEPAVYKHRLNTHDIQGLKVRTIVTLYIVERKETKENYGKKKGHLNPCSI